MRGGTATVPARLEVVRLPTEANGHGRSSVLATLTPERRLLLDRLHGHGTAGSGPRPRAPGTGEIPLSYAQEQMWVMDRLLGSGALAATPIATRLYGRLDVAALRQAVAGVVARHEALRTTFALVDGEAVQQVQEPPFLDFSVVDLRGQEPAACAVAAASEAKRDFDLRTGPLLRVRVYQLGLDDHVLLVARHHIIFDPRSDQVFLHELGELYRRSAAGGPSGLAELPVQYPDFACWERGWLTGQRREQLVNHWRQALEGIPVSAPLIRPAAQQPQPGGGVRCLARQLPDGVTDRLGRLARQEQLTPFMLLVALLRVAMEHHSGQQDVLVGTPVSGRSRPETRDLIGCFVNLLVLRGDLRGDPTVRELAHRERARVLAAYDHQELPYALLAREVRPAGGAPLFQITFSHESGAAWAPVVALDGLRSELFDVGGATAPHDLNVKVVQDGDRAIVHWAYRDGRFDEPAVVRLADHYLACVVEAASHPDRRVSQLATATARPPAPDPAPAVAPAPVVTWAGADREQPAGPVQELIADLWSELLDADPPGVTVSLFEAGGHSLTAAKLAFRLEETFGLAVTMADLLERPTIAQQAELVESAVAQRVAQLGPEQAGQLLDELSAGCSAPAAPAPSTSPSLPAPSH